MRRLSTIRALITADDHTCVQFLRLVKMPHDPQACQRALLLSKRSTSQSSRPPRCWIPPLVLTAHLCGTGAHSTAARAEQFARPAVRADAV